MCQGGRVQTRIGVLMLLATWMADCPTAVAHFLFNTANVPYVSLPQTVEHCNVQEIFYFFPSIIDIFVWYFLQVNRCLKWNCWTVFKGKIN